EEKGLLVIIKEREGAGAINAQKYVEVLQKHLVFFCCKLIARFENNAIFQDTTHLSIQHNILENG
ncbi:13162_t:CDS:1, partial [Cetraspora pellucida]